jgi:hypothetical protein
MNHARRLVLVAALALLSLIAVHPTPAHAGVTGPGPLTKAAATLTR